MKKKKFFLNACFIVVLVITLVLHIHEYLYYKNEMETARELNGDGYYVAELFMFVAQISLLGMLFIEISIYRNLHYFIVQSNKTTVKTVLNIIMLLIAVVLIFLGLPESEAEFSALKAVILMFLILRILYFFTAKKY